MRNTTAILGLLASLATAPIALGQVITTVAGTDWIFPQNPLPGVNAPLGLLPSVATDDSGNVYALDGFNCIVVKIAVDGTLSIVAGNGICGLGGDGGPAIHSGLLFPIALAVGAGSIYVKDSYRIRKVDSNGIISTIAGTGIAGFSGDGGPAVNAQVSAFGGMAVDASGNLFLAEGTIPCVREVDSSGIINTVAGTCLLAGSSDDGGPGTSALLTYPFALAFDRSGNLFIADEGGAIRKLSPGGIISTAVTIHLPAALAVDNSGNIYTTSLNRIYEVAPNGQPIAIAGTGDLGFSGDGGPALSAVFGGDIGLAVDSSNNLIISDPFNARLRKIAGATINTIAGNGGYRYNGENVPATLASLNQPYGLAQDSAGRLYLSEALGDRVRRIGNNGLVTTFAGTGLSYFCFVEACAPATSGVVFSPQGLASMHSEISSLAVTEDSRR